MITYTVNYKQHPTVTAAFAFFTSSTYHCLSCQYQHQAIFAKTFRFFPKVCRWPYSLTTKRSKHASRNCELESRIQTRNALYPPYTATTLVPGINNQTQQKARWELLSIHKRWDFALFALECYTSKYIALCGKGSLLLRLFISWI